jgi:small redox-active disulfide protein 2
MTHVLEVFGPGCAKCKALKDSAKEAVVKLGWKDAKIIYTTDMDVLIQKGISVTPALTLNGKLVLSGKYLPPEKLVQLLQNEQ